MRIFLALMIAVCLLGGTQFYTQFADRVRASAVKWEPDYSAGKYSIEIDRSFECIPDDLMEEPALTVRFRGKTIYENSNRISANDSIRIDDIQGVEVKSNDINVTAFLDPDMPGLAAMRIRVYRDNAKIKEVAITDTADLGSIGGSISFYVDESHEDHEGEH